MAPGILRRAVLQLPALAAAQALRPGWARAQPVGRTVKIGVLNDQNSVFSDSTGMGSVIAAQLAAEDAAAFGQRAQIIAADHQNKADIGAEIARGWFDRNEVDAIADLGNSAVALAVSAIGRAKNKTILVSAGGTTLLTGAQCSPNTVQWTYDTYGQTHALAQALAEQGQKTWFFITADYTFGQSLQDETAGALAGLGGRVVGAVRHPLNTADFSAYLLQAKASGAQIIGLANGGDDTARCVKQAHEFGVAPAQTLAGLSMLITDVQSIGLPMAQGLLLAESFYWNLNARTRHFADRWAARSHGRRPTMMQAGVYGVVLQYLKAVQAQNAAGATTSDGAAVVARMKAMRTDDDAFGAGSIRADGRAIHPIYVLRVKQPAESHGPWDDLVVLRTIPGAEAYRPMASGGCHLPGIANG